jgi:hypothetical protein
MSKSKAHKANRTRPSLRALKRATTPPDDEGARRKRSEAPTMPPPAPGEEVKQSGRVKKRGASAVTVDVVIADLSKDGRRED